MSAGRPWGKLVKRELEDLGELERPAAGPRPKARVGRWRKLRGCLFPVGAGEDVPREPEAAEAPRPPEWRREAPARDLFGLALSGGGIRSATFNLGLLQELHRKGLLACFHYLATVSGGGYIGGFWSAWRSREGRRPGELFPQDGPTRDRPEPPEVRHLREFGNFLRPRLQLLSTETGRLVTALVGGVLPCIATAVAVLVVLLLAWWSLDWLLVWERPGRLLLVRGLAPLSGLILALATFGVQWFFEHLWWHRGEEPANRAAGTFFAYAILTALVAGAVWSFLWGFALPAWLLLCPLQAQGLGVGAGAVLLPVVAWLVTVLLIVISRRLFSVRAGLPPAARSHRGARDRVLARMVLCAAAWAVVGAVWILGQLLAGGGPAGVLSAAGVSTAGGGVFTWVRRLLSGQASKPSGGRLSVLGKRWVLQALAYLTLGAAVATVVSGLVLLTHAAGPWGAGGAAIAASIGLLFSLTVDPHEIGFHSFYRSRLVRAYLGASNSPRYTRATEECEHDDVALTDLAEGRPLHLVCCAANDLAGDPLGSFHRGAASAVLSKLGFQVGDRWRPWVEGAERPTLGSAITASGAAFNSHMGQLSMRFGQAVTFLLTALGLRLGLWLAHPDADRRGRAPGYLFLQELLGLSHATGPWVYLSDGAHFENLALYELVRRHCRFILLSDCGADPERAFDDFGNAVRRVREDFGIEIKIDVSPLRPGSGRDGLSRQPMVAGDIYYPPAAPGGKGDVGILLYVKPTLTGDEPADIAQYARRNLRFPHETTIDQFYDEAQWESYRRLGEHVVEEAFEPVESLVANLKGKSPSCARLFLRARYSWPPLPEEEPVIEELNAAWVRLGDRLEAPGLERLRREVSIRFGDDRVAARASKKDVLAALPAVREAVRIMEAVCLRTGFGKDDWAPSNPRYMGWLNRFGAWASSPTFRGWWPWLAPFHSQEFTRFMAEAFGLGWDLSKGSVKPLHGKASGGHASTCWKVELEARKARGDKVPPSGTRLYGFFLPMPSGRGDLHAGLVEILETSDSGKVATWDHGRDFFVAPGLWGLGIGEEFLTKLLETLARDGYHQVKVTPAGSDSATNDALYTGAGFRREDGLFVKPLTGKKDR